MLNLSERLANGMKRFAYVEQMGKVVRQHYLPTHLLVAEIVLD
jgi:hypothetical protein